MMTNQGAAKAISKAGNAKEFSDVIDQRFSLYVKLRNRLAKKEQEDSLFRNYFSNSFLVLFWLLLGYWWNSNTNLILGYGWIVDCDCVLCHQQASQV